MRTVIISLLVVYCSVYTASITLSPCAKWSKAGTTISKTADQIQLNEEIVSPTGVFIDKLRNALYISDGEYTGRIHFLSLNQSSNETTVIIYGLTYPNRIFVDNDADGSILYITLPYFNRVEKWFSGATHGIQIGESFRSCSGISVDVDENFYVSESALHCISKWSPKTNQTVVVAGQKGSEGGLSNSELHNPSGIYVSRSNGDIYIADTFNHRIQRWSQNTSEGITVAGSSNGTEGSDSALLNNPNAVWVDEDTDIIYIVDSFNNRIQRYYPDASEGDTIAGQLNAGDGSDQLNQPSDLAFDNKGNLYVSDKHNNRIQMFTLIDNQPCSPTSKGNSSKESKIAINMVILFMLLLIKLFI